MVSPGPERGGGGSPDASCALSDTGYSYNMSDNTAIYTSIPLSLHRATKENEDSRVDVK